MSDAPPLPYLMNPPIAKPQDPSNQGRRRARIRSIPTARRLEYANGYILLGMLHAAADELQLIRAKDRAEPEVLELLMELYKSSRRWRRLVATARQHAELWPGKKEGWVMWAQALRHSGRPTAARSVLRRGRALCRRCSGAKNSLA